MCIHSDSDNSLFSFIYSLWWLIKINCYKEFIDPKLFVNMCVFSVCLSLTYFYLLLGYLLLCSFVFRNFFHFFATIFIGIVLNFYFHYLNHCGENLWGVCLTDVLFFVRIVEHLNPKYVQFTKILNQFPSFPQ